MVTHPILLGGIIPFGSTLLVAKNRYNRRVSIQGNGFKFGLIKPIGIIVQKNALNCSALAMANFLERNSFGVFIDVLFQVQKNPDQTIFGKIIYVVNPFDSI